MLWNICSYRYTKTDIKVYLESEGRIRELDVEILEDLYGGAQEDTQRVLDRLMVFFHLGNMES